MSSDNIVAVVFASDFRVNGAGFNLTFAAIDGELLSASHTQLTENVSGTLCFCYIKVWLGLTSSERYYYVSLWFHKGLADPFVLKTLFKH